MDTLKADEKAGGLDEIERIAQACYDAMNDDFNSPILIANLFEASKIINSAKDGRIGLNEETLQKLKTLMQVFIIDVLGLKDEVNGASDVTSIMDFIIKIRSEAKINQDYAMSDKIRIGLQDIGYQLKDSKEGTSWTKI